MGNKQSSQQKEQKVKKRDKKKTKDGGGKRERPLSDSGLNGSASGAIDFTGQGLKPTSALTGKQPMSRSLSENFTTNPLLSQDPAADYDDIGGSRDLDDVSSKREPPKSKQSTNSSERSQMVDEYWRSLSEISKIWGDYRALKDMDIRTIPDEHLPTFRSLFQKLYDQNSEIETLKNELREQRLSMSELDEEKRAVKQSFSNKLRENETLKEEIERLENELYRRHGVNGTEEDFANMAEYETPQNVPRKQKVDTNGIDTSDGAKNVKISKHARMGQATPFLLAEGPQKTNVVERSQSLKPVSTDSPRARARKVSVPARATSDVVDPRDYEDLQRELERTKSALERERRTNLYDMIDPQVKAPYKSRKGSISTGDLSNKYNDLQREALSNILPILSKNLGHVNEKRRQMFICAIIEMSFRTANELMTQFQESLKNFLVNPIQSQSKGRGRDQPSSRSAIPMLARVQSFQEKGMSKLAQRTRAAIEIPHNLVDDISGFIENKSEVTDLSSMVEEVVDSLHHDYSQCITSGLLNHSMFSQFLHNCCRLAWRMNVINPPMDISADCKKRFDEHYHQTYTQRAVAEAEIDHFVWPILLTKMYGDVLCRGTVVLKSDIQRL